MLEEAIQDGSAFELGLERSPELIFVERLEINDIVGAGRVEDKAQILYGIYDQPHALEIANIRGLVADVRARRAQRGKLRLPLRVSRPSAGQDQPSAAMPNEPSRSGEPKSTQAPDDQDTTIQLPAAASARLRHSNELTFQPLAVPQEQHVGMLPVNRLEDFPGTRLRSGKDRPTPSSRFFYRKRKTEAGGETR